MPREQRLQRLKLFLDFWYSPWGAAKSARWEFFTGDMTYHLDSAILICRAIINCEQLVERLDWSALEDKKDAA